MVQMLRTLWRDEEAPTAVEYGLMVALIAVAIIVVVQTLGTALQDTFTGVTNAMP
jgi:pilus assembly protein Flp/PilA